MIRCLIGVLLLLPPRAAAAAAPVRQSVPPSTATPAPPARLMNVRLVCEPDTDSRTSFSDMRPPQSPSVEQRPRVRLVRSPFNGPFGPLEGTKIAQFALFRRRLYERLRSMQA